METATTHSEITHSVAKNTLVQMGQQIITWASTFLLMLFLPRYLGPVNYGRLFLAISIKEIFGMIVEFDGRIGVAKRISRSRETSSQTVIDTIGFRIILWGISFTFLMVFLAFTDYPSIVRAMITIFGVELLWLGIRNVLFGLFVGYEMIQYASIGNILERVFVSIFGIIAVLLGANTIVIAVIMIAGTLLNVFACTRFAHKLVTSLRPRFNWNTIWGLAKDGIPYLLYAIFGLIYYRIDSIMLSFLVPERVVGWYGASYRFFDVLAFLPSIYSASILPVLSRLWGKEDKMLAKTTEKSLEFIMMAGIPMSIGVYAFAEQIIGLFFGLSGFGPSVFILQIFSFGIMLLYIDMILSTTLFACDKQRQWAVVAFFAIFINVGLNYFLIPYFQNRQGNGGVGAAIATLLTELYVMISAINLLPKDILDRALIPVTLKAIFAGVLMALSIWSLRELSIHWLLQGVVGFFVYIAVLLMMKTLQPEELSFVKRFLSVGNLRHLLVPSKKGANA